MCAGTGEPMRVAMAPWLDPNVVGVRRYWSLLFPAIDEAVRVVRAKDYSAGLSRIIGNLTARYSLGFALAESEVDDGRMHSLEVRVQAKDDKGKKRKLLVSSRQGYYMSSAMPKEAATRTQ